MPSFSLFDRPPCDRASTTYSTNADEVSWTKGQAAKRVAYHTIERIELSKWIDWKFRKYHRCRLRLVAGGLIDVYSDVSDQNKQEVFHPFVNAIAVQAAAENAGLQVVRGIHLGKWIATILLHVVLAFLFAAFFVWAPRNLLGSLVVTTVFLVYWVASLLIVLQNMPQDLFPSGAVPGGSVSHFASEYLAKQHERFVAPFQALLVFLYNPSVLAAAVSSRDKKSFKTAAGTIALAFVGWAVFCELFYWYLALSPNFSLKDKLLMQGRLLVLPALLILASFIILSVIFRYRELSFGEYFHGSTYAAAWLILIQVIFAIVSLGLIFQFVDLSGDWLSRIPPVNKAACNSQATVGCVVANFNYLLKGEDTYYLLVAGLLFITALASIAVLVRHALLLTIAFRISYLHAYSAIFSPLVIALYVWFFFFV
jgi:hypothetical protein